jgi:hypothetical protein
MLSRSSCSNAARTCRKAGDSALVHRWCLRRTCLSLVTASMKMDVYTFAGGLSNNEAKSSAVISINTCVVLFQGDISAVLSGPRSWSILLSLLRHGCPGNLRRQSITEEGSCAYLACDRLQRVTAILWQIEILCPDHDILRRPLLHGILRVQDGCHGNNRGHTTDMSLAARNITFNANGTVYQSIECFL